MPTDQWAKAKARDIARRASRPTREEQWLEKEANRLLSQKKRKPGKVMKMPFGKYRGRSIKNIPVDYLVWLRDNCQLSEPLKSSVCTQIKAKTHARKKAK